MYAEKQEIEKLRYLSKNEKNVKQKRRYDSVLLCMEGYTEKEASEILHISIRTVNANVGLYKKGGTDALLIKKQPGMQKKIDSRAGKRIIQYHCYKNTGRSRYRYFRKLDSTISMFFGKETIWCDI